MNKALAIIATSFSSILPKGAKLEVLDTDNLNHPEAFTLTRPTGEEMKLSATEAATSFFFINDFLNPVLKFKTEPRTYKPRVAKVEPKKTQIHKLDDIPPSDVLATLKAAAGITSKNDPNHGPLSSRDIATKLGYSIQKVNIHLHYWGNHLKAFKAANIEDKKALLNKWEAKA